MKLLCIILLFCLLGVIQTSEHNIPKGVENKFKLCKFVCEQIKKRAPADLHAEDFDCAKKCAVLREDSRKKK